MAGSSRDGTWCSSLENSLREEIAELHFTMSAKDSALMKANMEIDELRQELAQSRLSNCPKTLAAAAAGSAAGSFSKSHISTHSVSSSIPFNLTAEEWTLFDKAVKTMDCRSSLGKIQWELVAQEFANATNSVTIYARDKARLESSYKNLSTARKAELNAVATAKLAANTDQEPATVSQVAASSSNSAAIARNTSTTITTSLSSQSVMPIVRLKSQTDFSTDERAKIKEWGITRRQMMPPQDVTEKYLFHQHHHHFHSTLNYVRKGCELKNVWDSWWKDNKHKYK